MSVIAIVPLLLYIGVLAFVVYTIGFGLKQLRRIADAQEEMSRYLLEMAHDIKSIAVSRAKDLRR